MRAFVLLVFLMGVCLAEESVLDGKVFVKSDPTGADVFLVLSDGKFDNLGKTPALVKVPLGKVKLLIQLEKYQVSSLELDLKDASIQKPDTVKLAAVTHNVDVVFEEGWTIYVDKVLLSQDNKPVVTPATIHVSEGAHEIGLAKTGFRDIVIKAEVTKDTSVTVAEKPVNGKSVLVTTKPAEIKQEAKQRIDIASLVGKWAIRYANGTTREYAITLDSSVSFLKENRDGKIKMIGEDMVFDFDDGKLERFKLLNGKLIIDHFMSITDFPQKRFSTAVGVKQDEQKK